MHTRMDELLREAAPTVATDRETGSAMAALAHAVTGGRAARRPARRRARTLVAAGVATLTLGGTGVAVAAVLHAHTGWFGAPGMTENDESEWIDNAAPDIRAAVAGLAPESLPLPPRVTIEDATTEVVAQAESMGGLQQATGIRSTYVYYAQCQWKRALIESEVSAETAADALVGLADSPELIAVDGGGIRDLELSVAAAARGGDLARVRQDFEAACAGGLGNPPQAVR